ncbi:hypothetical protein ACTXM3_17225 [Glutamicibacter arilaitensis]|uniref:hypothetical protein n=1 Tax=Glutamicibacter arilaitensis TaxID=256701 RepID=UPI003FCF49E3
MDATSIILTIGAVIAGLILLWAILALILGAIARRAVVRFSQKADEEHEAWRKRHGLF